MRHLIFVRHAKSSWSDQGLSDHERPLNSRGQRDAPVMGEWLAQTIYSPEVIITSSAVRAHETALIFQSACGLAKSEFLTESSLYLAGMQEWIQILQASLGQEKRVAFFSHNPGITQVVNWLCNEAIYNIPTCGVAIVAVPKNLKRFDSGVGELVEYKTPKTLN